MDRISVVVNDQGHASVVVVAGDDNVVAAHAQPCAQIGQMSNVGPNHHGGAAVELIGHPLPPEVAVIGGANLELCTDISEVLLFEIGAPANEVHRRK